MKKRQSCKVMNNCLCATNEFCITSSNNDMNGRLLGPTYSSEAEIVSTILSSMPKKYYIPQIGYSTTSSDLGNHDLYPNFFRTIPSDVVQMKALASLLVNLEWNMIQIIYENDAYGKSGALQLAAEVKDLGICIPVTSRIEIDNWNTLDLQLTIAMNESLEHSINGIVFIGGQQTAKRLMEIVDKRQSANTPAFIFSEAVQSVNVFHGDENKIFNASKGALLMSPTKTFIEDFKNYWVHLFTNTSKLLTETSSNPWLLAVYKELSDCEPSNSSCAPLLEVDVVSRFPDSVFISYAVKAALTLAKTLKQIHSKLCGSQTNLCEAMQTLNRAMIVEELKNVRVDFEFDFPGLTLPTSLSSLEFDQHGNVIHDQVYEVYNHRTCVTDKDKFCLVQVATFKDNINLNTQNLKDYDSYGNELLSYRKAHCPVGNVCSICLSADGSDQMSYMYIPGDLVMITTFALHDKGTDALACGGLRSRIGLDIGLTAQYIVEKINRKTDIYKNIFPNHSIGLLLIDGCNEPIVLRNRVLSLFRSQCIPGLPSDLEERIIGITGSLGSTPTIALAEVSSNLKIPHVGCCSTSPLLSDRDQFPYFVRVSSPVNRNAEVMVSIAETLKGKYVQIVYSEGDYGESGKNAIVEEAKKRHICIAQIIQVVENVDYDKVLPALRKFPNARFVLLVLRSHVNPPIMTLFTDDSKSYAGEFQFIASETWGTRDEYKQSKLVGSITVAQEMAQSDEYVTWLSKQLPKSGDKNMWLQTFIERRFDCYFSWSFNKQASRQCDDNDRLPGNSNQRLDPWTPYLLNAQLALLIGADSAIKELCPHNLDTKICSNYKNNPDIVMNHIRKVKLDLSGLGRQEDVFNENGNGVFGYKIYNLQSDLEYKQVGEGIQGIIEIKIERLEFPPGKNISSRCLRKEECPQCSPTLEVHNSPSTKETTSSTVLYAVIGILSVLLVLLAITFFVCMKKARNESPYLTATDYGPYMTTTDSEIYRTNGAHLDNGTDVHRRDRTNSAMPTNTIYAVGN